MLHFILLTAALTASQTPYKDPLKMSSRDLKVLNKKPVSIQEKLTIKAACTDPNGKTFDSDSQQYVRCVKDAEHRRKQSGFSQDPHAPRAGKLHGPSVQLGF